MLNHNHSFDGKKYLEIIAIGELSKLPAVRQHIESASIYQV
ncbi:hypothetical protein VCRA2126O85_60196 [Vibrio crassostreae]|nr:hypothetical protein VCRA2125O83_60034 [Vibrio crassostreae]CAK3059318.1 hypothetical protein VCRA2126O84_60034 [Vibrio crassostreae]CAK3071771.1 hypothetical protein VCRA2126O86_60196 [Vibrio crassostreae]CAK3074023.1 hypothetical protein VCRA2126O85_60196 [Vibrio crassostreae]CAK3074305.1 hypothetical protein VCRA2128O106_60197 [Vibrio crassostreae]